MGQRKGWYAGPRGFEEWKRTPAINQDFSPVGFSDAIQYLNGGIGVDRSSDAHKEYNLSWNLLPRADARQITDMSDGVWDGDGEKTLIYHLDPMAMDTNLFSRAWATPAQGARDGMPLFINQTPSLITTASNGYRYPARSAVYRADGDSQKFYCPLPAGFSAWVGFHGSATGAAGVRVTPYNGSTAGAPVSLVPLSVATSQLVNREFQANSGITGIEIDFIPTGLLRNYSVNPSFETDLFKTSATIDGGGGVVALSRQTGTAKDGTAVARATWTTAATAAGGGVQQDIPVDEDGVYSFGMYGRTSLITRVRPTLVWLNAAGAQIGPATLGTQAVTTAAPAWTSAPQFKLENQIAPAGAVTARFRLETVAGTSYANIPLNGWIEIDAIQVNDGATLQTFHTGNHLGWEWLGTLNDSVSRQTPDTITLSGLILQVLPTGSLPVPGLFISGQGNSGCEFAAEPKVVAYSAKHDLTSISAKLVETGSWL